MPRFSSGAHRRHGCFPGLRSWLQAPDAAPSLISEKSSRFLARSRSRTKSWAAEDEGRHQEREPPMYPRAR